MTPEQLREVLREEWAEKHSVHGEHHEWIEMQIKKQQLRDARMEKFRMSIIGTAATGLVGVLAWVGKIIWEHVFHGHVQ